MNCATVERYLDALVDGEVDPSAGIEVQSHITGCSACAERLAFAEWLKRSLKQTTAPAAPHDFRGRIEAALEAERTPGFLRIDASWRTTAAAAAVALCMFGLGGALELKGETVSAGVAPIFEDVVRAHMRSYPAEVASRDQVPAYFEQRVGFSVRPVEFADPAVHFVGARQVEVGGRQAATLQYEAHGRRITVVAFRPPAYAARLGDEVDEGGRSIRYVRVGGHLVPIVEHGGVIYAVVGDLEPQDRLKMAARASLR